MLAINERIHDLALTFTSGIGDVTIRNLIAHFGSAKAVMESTKNELRSVGGIGDKTSSTIYNSRPAAYDRAEQELSFIKKHNIQIFTLSDQDYPRRLKECYDAPWILYYRGNANLNSSKIISIVGSRKATAYGRKLCSELVEELSPYNPLIVSGLAYGIDTCAHKACVEYGIPTVAVLGHGLDQIYPPTNRDLAKRMLNNGGILSEFPFLSKPERANFPKRNRIIAGLSDVVIVVEAAIQGGALITAEIANNYNRDVCAFPGNVNQEYSAGCNFLIKSHRAHLISRAQDLEYLMGWQEADKKPSSQQLKLNLSLSPIQEKIYNLVKLHQPISIDEISGKLKTPQSRLTIVLLELEMKGLLVALPGKIFKTLH